MYDSALGTRHSALGGTNKKGTGGVMGFPNPSHPKETVVLSRYFGDSEARTFAGWVKRGGYEGVKKALTMTPEAIIEEIKASGLRGRGGGGVPDRAEVELHAQGG